ncbi:DNA replication/repair protein RecF [Paenibacillus ginsengarvi]|uniref:DNA replication and repair protein RecF n=1 Tax=Paenibacillus ginsengarvi TaxID=400777 RepID=A0A3B0CLD0_9BACL|nr:DNA replication/repair protein RecF [Paenibacillus ginsengarvi]RKN86012.1 DNA replication/repair protein RecF [Paenibacillus ginsengarvi]
MHLKKLALRDYRNYESVELATEGAVNIIIGPNAQGKTNLLEAIFVLALTKSHRTHQDKELIRFGAERTMLRGEIEKKYGPCTLDLTFTNQGKKAKINGLDQKRLSDFIGALNVVMFAPEDLNIVKGSPSIRRQFLNMEIGQVQPSYLYDLSQYQKVLAQRNNMLKTSFRESKVNETLLEVWNEQLVTLSIKIMKKRQNFIHKLQKWAESIHMGITNGTETLEIGYVPSFAYDGSVEESVLFEQFMIKLSQAKDQEMRRGTTLYGPHKDDLAFSINKKDVQTFGSQGQQRTTALSLKLAEIEFIQEEVGEYPILLLDDVLSELDTYRQTQLLETFQTKVQTFITTTGTESLQMNRLKNASIFHVRNGQLV